MTNKIYIVFLLVIGLLIPPAKGISCHIASSTNTSEHINHTTPEKKKSHCCSKHSNNKESNDTCKDKCSSKSCNCPTTPFNPLLPIELAFNTYTSIVKESKFHYTEHQIASGYYSIWQPPKISNIQ